MMKFTKRYLITVGLMIALVAYFLAPPDTEPGLYFAELSFPNPNNGEIIRVPFNFTLSEFEESGLITKIYKFSNFSAYLKFREKYLLKPGSPIEFYVKIIWNNGTSIHLVPDSLVISIEKGQSFHVEIRPTKVSDDEYYFVYHPLVKSNEAFFILFFIAFLWFTEALPLASSALLIPVFAVVFQILEPKYALSPFFSPATVLIMGGLFIGRALQKYQIDKRIALLIVSKTKGHVSVLMLAMMYTTAFLSFWISNTAAAAVMLPIGLAVVYKVGNGVARTNYGKIVILGIAYSATIGGIATLIGTPPNLVAAGMLQSILGINFSFVDWLPFGLPYVIIFIPIVYKILITVFKPEEGFENSLGKIMQESKKELEKLGPITLEQKAVLIVFTLTIILWLTEKVPDFIAKAMGFNGHGISSSIVALIGVGGLFILGLLGEEDITKINWSAIFIIGGGLALGEIITRTGVSDWIAQSLGLLQGTHILILNFVVGAHSLILTMFASNTAAAAILVPIAIPLAISLGVDPILLTITIAIAASLDFALPVGTPPSTLAYSTGMVKLKEMIKVGLILDIISLLLLTFGMIWIWFFLGLITL